MKHLLLAVSALSLLGGAAAQAQPHEREAFRHEERREALRDRYWYGGRWNERRHGPAYVFPPGHAYRRWSVGQILPPAFLAPGFFIGDWGAYRLPPPPPRFHYVRVGPDILLVGPRGYIRQVIPGFFY